MNTEGRPRRGAKIGNNRGGGRDMLIGRRRPISSSNSELPGDSNQPHHPPLPPPTTTPYYHPLQLHVCAHVVITCQSNVTFQTLLVCSYRWLPLLVTIRPELRFCGITDYKLFDEHDEKECGIGAAVSLIFAASAAAGRSC